MEDDGRADSPEISTREWYDFVGLIADVIPTLHLGGHQATEDLLELCNLGPESRVLDVGCGGGETACYIAKVHGSQVVGIDISEVMVSKAKRRVRAQKLEDRVEFRVADVYRLPFEDESYDVALFESVLTPLPGFKLDALKETFRVIKPGGLIGANESVLYSSAPAEFMELVMGHPAVPGGIFTPAALKRLFEESGLQVVEFSEVKASEAPGVSKGVGVLAMLSFMVKSYWKVLYTMLTDSRFRKAQKLDDRLTKTLKEHGGYVLIVGQKPI